MTDNLLEQGISAALTGRRDEARALLAQVVEADEHNEQAWLWLAGLVDEPEDMRTCLENVLHLNPSNVKAREGLAWVMQRYGAQLRAESAAVSAPPAPAPQPAPQSAEAIAALLADSARPAQLHEQSPPAATAVLSSGSTHYRSLNEAPVAAALNQLGEAPCLYCGAPTLLKQKRCPKCHESQMFRAPPEPEKGSRAMTFLAWCWLIPAVIGYAAFAITVLIGFAEGLRKGSPGLLGIVILIVVVIVFTVIYALLWSPFLLLARGLYRCRRWAYIIQFVWTAIELALALIVVLVLLRMPGGLSAALSNPAMVQRSIIFSSPSMFWASISLGIGWRLFVFLLLGFGYGAVFGRKSRLVPTVKVSYENYNNGLAYRKRRMWYMAVQEWEAALIGAPLELEYLHTLGLGYAQIKQFDKARATLDRALQLAPSDARIADSRALVERMEKRAR